MTTSLTLGGSSTAAAAALAFGLFIVPPTLNPLSGNSLVRTPIRNSTAPPANERRSTGGASIATTFASDFPFGSQLYGEVAERQTNHVEKTVGEMRRWSALAHDWDGEGAEAPVAISLKSATDFIRLLPANIANAEPMLHANGHAGLFWNENGRYADLEFLGDGRIAYFIQHNEDKHKGLVHFNNELVPAALSALLETADVV